MKNSQDMLKTQPNMVLLWRPKLALFKDIKERGWPSPFGDFKAPSPPLKSLKISVGERPKYQSLGALTKWPKNGPFQGLRVVKPTQSAKHS